VVLSKQLTVKCNFYGRFIPKFFPRWLLDPFSFIVILALAVNETFDGQNLVDENVKTSAKLYFFFLSYGGKNLVCLR
jgi:hypothetical protein